MKRFLKFVAIALVMVSTLGLSGCDKGNAEKKAKEKIKLVSVDGIKGSLSDGWKVTVTVENKTGFNIRVHSANLRVKLNGHTFANAALANEIKLPRRSTTQVEIPIKTNLSASLSTLKTLAQIKNRDFKGITADYNVTVSAMGIKRTFSEGDISLKEVAQKVKTKIKNFKF